MELIKQKCWIEVDVSTGLPKIEDYYFVLCTNTKGELLEFRMKFFKEVNEQPRDRLQKGEGFFDWHRENEHWFMVSNVTHWLKPIEDKYVLSESELKELIEDTWQAAREHEDSAANPTLSEYLQSLTNKTLSNEHRR